MQELSMNILDVAGNGVKAGAGLIEITLRKNPAEDRLFLSIRDNGCGMDEETRKRALDPFYTSRSTRKVGLGLPFLRMAAEMAGGGLTIDSEPGRGTEVRADFQLSNIDLAPLGDMGETLSILASTDPGCDIVFRAVVEGAQGEAPDGGETSFTFDTRQAKELLGGVPLTSPEVMVFIRDYVNEHFNALWDRNG